jgi:signal transduction histidine kinase
MVTGNWGFMPWGATDPNAVWPYAIAGLVLVFAVWWLRMRFPWFFIDPTALTMSMAVGLIWTWLFALIALILRVILIRVMGVKRFEEYVIPIGAGAALGFGAPIIVTGLIELFTVVLPRFSAFYVP